MKIRACELAVGDVMRLRDWKLHVVGLERECAIGVLTAELTFLIHFGRDDVVDVLNRADSAQPIPRAA